MSLNEPKMVYIRLKGVQMSLNEPIWVEMSCNRAKWAHISLH